MKKKKSRFLPSLGMKEMAGFSAACQAATDSGLSFALQRLLESWHLMTIAVVVYISGRRLGIVRLSLFG